ncbi:MAG TPA: dickkopf-related protein [Polyangiaceae bacterium]|nr:dickkopf-related protein [Polyangiaceae bacterium]
MAKKRWSIISAGVLLVSGSCELAEEHERDYCSNTHKECHLSYSAVYGYQRYCSSIASPCEPQLGVQSNRPATADAGTLPSAKPATVSAAERAPEPGPAPLPEGQRYSAFDEKCVRDSQCGPGKCREGACYYGCQSDSQCGSGDRCAVEQGTRICLPDPNPPVTCTRSAQCSDGRVCLNGTCMQSCTQTEQCTNLVDRCASGVCQPDRRPLGQCVLSSECAEGFVCLDGACVGACVNAGDAGVCLPGATSSPTPAPAPVSAPALPEQPPASIPLANPDAGTPSPGPDAIVDEAPAQAPPEEPAGFDAGLGAAPLE